MSVLTIPVGLLWKVKIDLRRKLIIGAVLCLSIFMIIIAVVRIAFATSPSGSTDNVWLFFWQIMEATIGVLMVSITAIRSAFGREKIAFEVTTVSGVTTVDEIEGFRDTGPRTSVPLGRREESNGVADNVGRILVTQCIEANNSELLAPQPG